MEAGLLFANAFGGTLAWAIAGMNSEGYLNGWRWYREVCRGEEFGLGEVEGRQQCNETRSC